MKATLNVRVILDPERSRSYVGFEGNVENAKPEEKLALRDRLVEAVSHILGLEATATAPVAAEQPAARTTRIDAEPASAQSADFEQTAIKAPEILTKPDEPMTAAVVEQTLTPEAENGPVAEAPVAQPEAPAQAEATEEVLDEPTMGFGKFATKTPTEILKEVGDIGIAELHSLAKTFARNLARYPKNQDKIDAIERAIARYEAQKVDPFTAKVDELTRLSAEQEDGDLVAINKLAGSCGTTWAEILAKRDTALLDMVYAKFKELLKTI